MSVPVIIIITRPPPPGGRTALNVEDRHEFPNPQEAIAFLEALVDNPKTGNTSES